MLKYLLLLALPCNIFGFMDYPPCLNEVSTHFFPSEVARQSFDLFYIFQSQWEPIISGLNQEVRAVPSIIKERARKMRPNPLEHPFDPEGTKELLIAVEYEVFRNVMIRNYIYDLQAIRGMFDYILSKQQKKIDACLGKKKPREAVKKI